MSRVTAEHPEFPFALPAIFSAAVEFGRAVAQNGEDISAEHLALAGPDGAALKQIIIEIVGVEHGEGQLDHVGHQLNVGGDRNAVDRFPG